MLKQKGFSLVEILVGLAAGSILLSALIALYVNTISSSNKLVATGKLEHSLNNTLSLMTAEIRRSGYYANALNDVFTGVNTNPFILSGVDINTPNTSCILFAYDAGNNGVLPALGASGSDGRFGFRLNNTAIEMRPRTLAGFSCNSDNWDALSDSNQVEITNLRFNINTNTQTVGSTSSLTTRSVDISISGRLISDNTITRTLTESVRIRNDKFIP
jgi:prepilin peptidase dependent protein B